MSDNPSSAPKQRHLSISIPSPTTISNGDKTAASDETASKSESIAKAEDLRLEEASPDEKSARLRLQTTLLANSSSVVNVASTSSTPNPLSVTSPATPNSEQPSAAGPSVINKQLLSKLNKSLKEKQKVIQNKESHTKNPTLIQDILTTSPLQAVFPHNAASSAAPVSEPGRSISPTLELPQDDRPHEPDTSAPPSVVAKELDTKLRPKNRRIAKQNSTRTDFFAAKLASAVDDVSSSNSDETFVYESNVNDFDDGANRDNLAGRPAGASASGTAVGADDTTVPNSGLESINHAPASILLVNDNISVAGSVRNATPLESTINSPNTEPRKEKDEEAVRIDNSRAESIHSLQSSKWNARNTLSTNTTPPNTMNGRLAQPPNLAHAENPAQFLNPYFDGILRDASNKAARRKSSSHSLISEDKSYLLRSPVLHYSEHNHNGVATHLPNLRGLNEGCHESTYSFDEEDDDDVLCGDAASSQADVHLIGADSNLNIASPGEVVPKLGHLLRGNKLGKKAKTSTTSSKLRSTTSKLFDKKGAQPRRYSTIPDDIDIEDFDDELIYYDNKNIRFPYNSQNGNESSSLLGGAHRLPHYRSLNLNYSGKRQPSKRYSSLGFVPPTSPVQQFGGKNNDIFPFPYPEANQKFYYDFDEYDEDAHADSRDEVQAKGMSPIRNHLSPTNNHFFLPRKVSRDNFGNSKVKFLKSFLYTLISIITILAIGFMLGFLLASTKDLTNLSIVSIENALVSQDELVFSIVVEALNPGWFTVTIEEVEIDIFAKSGYLSQPGEMSVETVLLGSVASLESPLVFEGSLLSRELRYQTGDIKLVAPGKNLTGSKDPINSMKGTPIRYVDNPQEPDVPDNSEKWTVISKHPFDLILRGVFKYSLPMTSNIKSAVVNKVGYVDPTTPNQVTT